MKHYILPCAVSGFLGGLLALWFAQSPVAPAVMAQEPRVREPLLRELDEFSPEERVHIGVYERVNRSVVNITTHSTQEAGFFLLEVPTEGSGSGSVLDQAGHILTNFHVIEGAKQIEVTLFTGDSYPATPVGVDPDNDMAVIKIEAPREVLVPVAFGDSSRLKVGQYVYAIGNPFGLERTLTQGIISSLNRTLPARGERTMKSIIQIDAALNRGNSGGPLMNSRAQLIGMNTAIASRTGENTGVGFAIPVNTIRRVVPQLIERGRVIRPDVGITRVFQTDKGLVIAALTPGGPAERAGLRGIKLVKQRKRRGPFVVEETKVDQSTADTVVAVEGQKVSNVDDLLSVVETRKPGDTITLTVIREGRAMNVPVSLGSNNMQ